MYSDMMVKGGSIIIEGCRTREPYKPFFWKLYELLFPEKKVYKLIEIVIY